MQQGTWQDPQSSWYRQPVAEDAPWWAQLAGSDPLMNIPGAQALRGAGQQLMGERAGRALTGLGRMFMPGAMASQNIRQGDYGAAGVDMGLDMLPLGGLARGAFTGGRRLVKEAGGNLGEMVGRRPFDFSRQTPYGPISAGFMSPAQYTRPFRQQGSDRLVVGRQNVGGGGTRMFATDQSGMNFRPMERFQGGSPQRIPGGGVNYGGSMMPGDQEFMDMLNSRYTFGSGVNPSPGWFNRTPVTDVTSESFDFLGYAPQTIAEGSGAGRLANTLARAPQKTADELNLMRGIKSGQFKPEPSQFITPPGLQSQYGASPARQVYSGAGLTAAPAAARTARDMREPEGEGRIFPSPSQRPRRSDPRPRQRRRNVVTND